MSRWRGSGSSDTNVGSGARCSAFGNARVQPSVSRGTVSRGTAWYADTPTRPLVRYDNDRGQFFELVSRP